MTFPLDVSRGGISPARRVAQLFARLGDGTIQPAVWLHLEMRQPKNVTIVLHTTRSHIVSILA
jgi:hypothetical protein